MKTQVSSLVGSANFIFCPQMPQRLLSLPLFYHILIVVTLSSLLSCCPQYLLYRLQKVQNNAACLALRVFVTDHISRHLHWLPLIHRYSTNSLLCVVFCLTVTASDYLTELLRIYEPVCQLCSSSDTSILCLCTACTPLVRGHFLMLCHVSGTLSRTKSGQRPLIFQIIS